MDFSFMACFSCFPFYYTQIMTLKKSLWKQMYKLVISKFDTKDTKKLTR